MDPSVLLFITYCDVCQHVTMLILVYHILINSFTNDACIYKTILPSSCTRKHPCLARILLLMMVVFARSPWNKYHLCPALLPLITCPHALSHHIPPPPLLMAAPDVSHLLAISRSHYSSVPSSSPVESLAHCFPGGLAHTLYILYVPSSISSQGPMSSSPLMAGRVSQSTGPCSSGKNGVYAYMVQRPICSLPARLLPPTFFFVCNSANPVFEP